MKFTDRIDAGARLAEKLTSYAKKKQPLILALPRGGVPVAAVIAKKLRIPFEILVVHKIGVPANPEYATGAVGPDGNVFIDSDIAASFSLDDAVIQRLAEQVLDEIKRREQLYRAVTDPNVFTKKHILLVDDGIATGATMQVAILYLKQHHPESLAVAIPVCPAEVKAALAGLVDEVYCVSSPRFFSAVGKYYTSFPQVTDEEVLAIQQSQLHNNSGV